MSDQRIRDQIAKLEQQLREVRDWAARLFTRFPTMPTGSGIGFDRIQCLAQGSFLSSDSTFTVDNVVATRGDSPLDDPDDTTETLEIHNAFNWDGDDNARVYAEFHGNDESESDKDKWYAYQVECPTT